MDTERLIRLIRKTSGLMEPDPTGEQPLLPHLPGIRAVVFDVYGTLFISGSGDISLARQEDRSPAVRTALEASGYRVLKPEAPWAQALLETIEGHRSRRAAQGIAHPEVRIEEVWADLLDSARNNEWLSGKGDPHELAVRYECTVNPVWPMPGAQAVLETLQASGQTLGIVSNAQFFTPLLFPALLDKPVAEYGFSKAHCVWSSAEREGKPSTALYRKLARGLEIEGILPGNALFIGNDLRNDIWPARDTGFRTALFAGDARSLRWRRNDPDCRDVQPDAVFTRLDQIPDLLDG